MNKKQLYKIINDNNLIKGDDWILTELEEGFIILQRKNNKVKGKYSNLRTR